MKPYVSLSLVFAAFLLVGCDASTPTPEPEMPPAFPLVTNLPTYLQRRSAAQIFVCHGGRDTLLVLSESVRTLSKIGVGSWAAQALVRSGVAGPVLPSYAAEGADPALSHTLWESRLREFDDDYPLSFYRLDSTQAQRVTLSRFDATTGRVQGTLDLSYRLHYDPLTTSEPRTFPDVVMLRGSFDIVAKREPSCAR